MRYGGRNFDNRFPSEGVEAAKRIRDTAMEQTLAARIPKSGHFGAIAQDADWLVDHLTAALPHLSQGADKKVFEWRGRAYFYEKRDDRPWGDYWKFIGSAALSPAPIGVMDEEAAREFVLGEPSPLQPEAEGLEVVAWRSEAYIGWFYSEHELNIPERMAIEPLVRLTDAERIIAEKNGEIERLQEQVSGAYHEGYSAREDVVLACRKRATEAEARAATLEKALKFYADVSKYPAPLTGGMGDLWSDCGERARAALASTGGQSDES